MATVLALSSQVARGHVGNSAAQFALQRLGAGCVSLPTVLLSSRPGYAPVARHAIAVEALEDMLAQFEANGWLAGIDAVLTGYFPSEEHVHLAARWVDRVRQSNPAAIYVCDPVIGDNPGGIYVDGVTAGAIRRLLMPRADIAMPNDFELGWLTGLDVDTPAGTVDAARRLGPAMVLATSAPAEQPDRLANMLVTHTEAWTSTTGWRDGVPHGTGDFIAGVFTGHLLKGASPTEALALATASMDVLTAASAGRDELELIASQHVWADPMPWPVHPVCNGNLPGAAAV